MQYLRTILYIVKIALNIYNKLYDGTFFNFDFFQGFIIDNNNMNVEDESQKQSTKDYNIERRHNLFFIKLIISVAFIGLFNLNSEQIGCIILSNIFSELIEIFIYRDKDDIYDSDDNNESGKSNIK